MTLVTCSSLGSETHFDKDRLTGDSCNMLCQWMVSAGQYTTQMITLRKQTYQFTYSHFPKVPLPTGGLSPRINQRTHLHVRTHGPPKSSEPQLRDCLRLCWWQSHFWECYGTYYVLLLRNMMVKDIFKYSSGTKKDALCCWRRNENVEDLKFLQRSLWWLLLCSFVHRHSRFGGTNCHHIHNSSRLPGRQQVDSKRSYLYEVTRQHVPASGDIQV